jgi:NAD(P)-dependent dehydrogenase (short-subunit alcohol dehydrogenase family)
MALKRGCCMETKRSAVVTGATAGIGLAVVRELAGLGISVIGVGRDENKCRAARERVLAECPGADIEYLLCDLSSQTQIRMLAAWVRERFVSLDILVNAAGTVSSRFMTSEDGIELQLAVNHLAPFLLTHELLPLLKESSQGRVVTVSSDSHYGAKLDFEDLQMRRHYSCLKQYRRVKLCNILFTAELNRRQGEGSRLKAFAADPGLVRTEIGLKGTSGKERLYWKLRMNSGGAPEVPGRAIAYLAAEPSLSGREEVYWKDGKPKAPDKYALSEEAAAELWGISEKLCRTGAERI